MGLDYGNLDERTRSLMLEEIDADIESDSLYLSDNLSPEGKQRYPELLKEAAAHGTDDSLSVEIRALLNAFEKPRRLKTGGYSKPPIMRSNAHTMLAEGEFNRFYIRAVCRRAVEEGSGEVTVYRAKEVQHARSASKAMIGSRVQAEKLLEDLRTHKGVDTALGLPPGPNSGLSVKL